MSDEIKKLYTNKATLYHFLFLELLGFSRKLKRFFETSNYLHPFSRVLDAGCGTGIITRVLYELSIKNKYNGIEFYGFDFTPKMLEIFRGWIAKRSTNNISLIQANTMRPEQLPTEWKNFDLIVTSGMLEYVDKKELNNVIHNLKKLLKNRGILLIFITRQNFITKWLVGKWWQANIYSYEELNRMLKDVGYQYAFRKFAQRWWNSTFAIEITNKN